MIIYKVSNKINGMLYVGQTTQTLVNRWQDHIRGDKQANSYLHKAIQKYSKENFTIEEIDSAKTPEGLNALEEYYIKTLNTLAPNGYNLLPGGLNRSCHPDTKKKISATLKGRKIPNRWNKGFQGVHAQETKDIIAAKLRGKAIKNRWEGGNTAPRTQDQKDHLSKLNKGKPNTVLYKPVQCSNGITYPSVMAAAEALELNRVTISSLIKSGKLSRFGLRFQFVAKTPK